MNVTNATQATARSGLNFLKQQVDRFETFHAANYQLHINEFCDWFVRDEVVALLYEGLRRHLTIAPKDWHDQANREGKVPPLPDDRASAMAFRFAVLRFVRRKKVDVRHFVTNHYPGAHLNEMMMHWKRLIVHPFAADCHTVADAVMARFGSAEWVDVVGIVDEYLSGDFQQEGFGPRAWTDADDERVEAAEAAAKGKPAPPAPAPAAPAVGDDPLSVALDALEVEVEGLRSKDLLLDMKALRLELRRSSLERARVLRRLKSMVQTRDQLRTACDGVRQHLP